MKAKEQDQQKWASVPEWKRKLLEQKEKEKEERERPKRLEEMQKKELQEKMAAMPPWKRELFAKKHGLELEG